MSQNFSRNQRIIHVSGPCASGKTTLANRVRNELPMADVAILDSDDFLTESTDDGKRLSKIDNDEDYTKEYMVVLKKNIVEFIQKNKRAKLIIFVGFFDAFTIRNEAFSKYVSSFAHERYYIQTELIVLIDRFFSRVKTLKKQHKWLGEEMAKMNIEQMEANEIVHYETELCMQHKTLQFLEMPSEVIFNRITELSMKADKTKPILFTYRNKKTGTVERTTLRIKQNAEFADEVQFDMEMSPRRSPAKHVVYFPIAQAEKIWALVYRLNSDGVFNFKTPPSNCDSVKYEENYGSGKELDKLFDLFFSAIE